MIASSLGVLEGLLPVGSGFVAAYWTVLVSELIGDKSLYTTASLTARFRPLLVLIGIGFAFGGKVFVAVLLGNVLLRTSWRWAMILSAIVFLGLSIVMWMKKPRTVPAQEHSPVAWPRATLVSFAALFFTEWGDPGQLAAAALAATLHQPVAIWLGGTLALLTKGVVAITVGVKLRDRVPERAMRSLAGACYGVMGIIALCEALWSQ